MGSKGGGGVAESIPALVLFADALQTKLRGVRYAIEDQWERVTAKKAVKAKEYVVQPGDNLLDIAERRGLTVGDLARFNNLPGVRKRKYFPVAPGEKLTIPTTEQLARMPAFEAPVMRDARKREEREKLATTVAAGLVVAVGVVLSPHAHNHNVLRF